MLTWLNPKKGNKVLDFGCYDGFSLFHFINSADDLNLTGIGIDISDMAIKKARQLYQSPRISFKVISEEQIPFPTGYFDIVICNDVLEHIEDDEYAIKEISRVLKPGGKLYCKVPNSYDDMLRIFRILAYKVDRIEGHLRHYGLDDLKSLFERHGLFTVKYAYTGFFGTFLWYWLVIFNAPVKKLGMRLITQASAMTKAQDRRQKSASHSGLRFNWLSKAVFALMHVIIWFDSIFSGSPRCLRLHIYAEKRNRVVSNS